jgi:hypothetical protein
MHTMPDLYKVLHARNFQVAINALLPRVPNRAETARNGGRNSNPRVAWHQNREQEAQGQGSVHVPAPHCYCPSRGSCNFRVMCIKTCNIETHFALTNKKEMEST